MDEKIKEVMGLVDTYHATGGGFYRKSIETKLRELVQIHLGYALVPVEPTEVMFVDGMEADCLGRPSVDDETHVLSIWHAMLAAAQKENAK